MRTILESVLKEQDVKVRSGFGWLQISFIEKTKKLPPFK
jgi:hypothetical protein